MAAPKKNAVEVKEVKDVVAAPAASLPEVVNMSDRVREALLEVKENLLTVESLKLPRAKVTSEGFQLSDDDTPAKDLEGVIIHATKTNVYYDKPYNASEVTPPTCFSLDGTKPDQSIEKPVSPTCKGCPMAEFGTNQMKSGKACRNLKPVYLIRKTSDGFAIIPRQIIVTPTSLKASNAYLMDLTERGISYRKVITKLTAEKENKADTYSVLKFSRGERLSVQDIADIEALRAQWLPIMDTQKVDSRDIEGAQEAPTVATAQGEF